MGGALSGRLRAVSTDRRQGPFNAATVTWGGLVGVKQSDCIGCGAPVSFIDRQYCCRCTARQKEAAAQATCPRCGQQRVLQEHTGRCIT